MKKLLLSIIFSFTLLSGFSFSLKDDFYLDLSISAIGMVETRIVDQSKRNRSNFVYEDFLAGLNVTAFFSKRDQLFASYLSMSVLYPLMHSFNNVPLKYINVLNLSGDFSLGGVFTIPLSKFGWSFLNLFDLSIMAGLHYNMLWEDRFFYHTMGPEVGARLEIKTYKFQKVDLYYTFAYDMFDMGSNKDIEPLFKRFMHKFGIGYRL
ncbi:MAG: hypothetical protein ACRC4W_04245 [Treponemataceae bacterium]